MNPWASVALAIVGSLFIYLMIWSNDHKDDDED